MPEILFFPRQALPTYLNWQIISFIRVTAPDALVGTGWFKYWKSPYGNDNSLHVVLVENGILLSHAEVAWRYIKHAGERYKAYGLTSVFTYPGMRGRGYGSWVVRAGTRYIYESDGDIGILNCRPELAGFYAGCGWTPMKEATALFGSESDPETSDETMMMLFVSGKGKSGRSTFESGSIYVGDRLW